MLTASSRADGAQRVLHGAEAPLLNFLLRDHVDGLRDVEKRRLQPIDRLLRRLITTLVARHIDGR